jgi:predicted nucleic acid-binding protein
MTRYFVDSNVFLRYYNGDDPEQRAAAAQVFLKAKNGEIELFCGPPVFFEVAWVLHSCYKIPNGTVLDVLESMMAVANLYVFDFEYVRQAILLARNMEGSYPDAYIAVVARDKKLGVVSFNRKHFAKLGASLYSFDTNMP